MFGEKYSFNNKLRIWQKPGAMDFNYSDGDEVEGRIYKILKETNDVSLASDDLTSSITDWPTEYHFSKSRHNLLRPFKFVQDDNILELGCGCGAITRQLGESGSRVIAIEGSQQRATIAAERCRDLPNVTVVCENSADYIANQKFSIVTLIGVLEYSRVFFHSNDPVQKCLELAYDHLDNEGILILAIENQLGLKYFNGCVEDHIGKPFFGINDLYAEDTPVTFGKVELSKKLTSAGFKRLKFIYPFPDYKIPYILISEAGLQHPNLKIGDLLARSNSRDYKGSLRRLFNENLVQQVLFRNGLIGDMSNSFLILAEKCEKSQRELTSDWLAKCYSTYRRSCFATENSFELDSGEIIVKKRRIFEGKNKVIPGDSDRKFSHIVSDNKYIDGKLYITELYRILATEGNLDEIVAWAKPWVDFLKAKSIHTGISNNHANLTSLFIPGQYIDCTPFNILRINNNEFIPIDNEWVSTDTIPLSWLIVRGIVYSVYFHSNKYKDMTCRQMLDMILPKLGLDLDAEKYKEIELLEDSFQDFCVGNLKGKYFSALLDSPFSYYDVLDQLAERDKQLVERDKLIERLSSSYSLKLTAPLRRLYNFFCQR